MSDIRCQFCWAVLSVSNWEGEHKHWCPVKRGILAK